MTTTIQAIYEGGLFRPTEKINLVEGTAVEVVIPQIVQNRDPGAVAATLARLAKSSPSTGKLESTSDDHDELLYGSKLNP
jgi:predicted DNA-binding antitoxin AbrB/MazE fold protein